MAGKIKSLYFAEGIETEAALQTLIETGKLIEYANDAAFLASKGSALEKGDCYYNTTLNVARIYNGTAWFTIAAAADLTSHTGNSTIHFTEGSIVHQNISGAGTNTHSQIDTHVADAVKHLPAVIGSNGQVATVAAGAVTWATPASAEGAPIGSIIPWIGGYFGDGSNGTFTNVLANTVANINTLLNSTGWYVCDGAALNDGDSPIFNGASRYLPNLTDERFLQGNTTAGGIGGSNTMIDHTHAHSLTVVAHTHTFSGTSAADGAHGHTGTTGTESNGHTHSMLADYGYGGTSMYWTMSSDNRSGTKQTGGTSNTHTHTFSTSTSSTHTHTYSGTTSGASASSISGSVGTGSVATSTNNCPKYLNVFFIMKVK